MSDKDSLLHISLDKALKDKLEQIKDTSEYTTISEFVREAIREKIRRMENPEVFDGSSMDKALLQKIYKLQLEQKKLLESNVKHGKIVNGNMKQLRERVNHQQVQLYRERVIDILKNHGSLRVEQISEYTSILDNEIIKVLSVLQEENLVNLNVKNGEWDLND